VSWEQFESRATRLASTLVDLGLRPNDKVAQYLFNGPEYLESVFASFKASFVPVNTNYRYRENELAYLWQDADVRAVVFPAALSDRIEPLRTRVPAIQAWLCVRAPETPLPPWAIDYEDAVATGADNFAPDRSDEDLWLLYTGGTTGVPKGVVWRQSDLLGYLLEASPTSPRFQSTAGAPLHVCACPLMHGTGSFTSFQALTAGGAVITLEERSFSAAEFLDAIDRNRATTAAIVGDAFCRPILDALELTPTRWDISSLEWIVSSGVIWSAHMKQALLSRQPSMRLIDSYASSEAVGIGRSVTTIESAPESGTFAAGPSTFLIDEDGRPIPAGSTRVGRVAVAGYLPQGYYKDTDRTAATFVTRAGARYAVPGDYATLRDDGTLTLLGRGALCINTGGEKVFAEEVEQVLKRHVAVADVVVVGVPDERFGQKVVAVVERATESVTSAELILHAKSSLAGFKAPKHIIFVDSIRRGPNGKVEYAAIQAGAAAELAEEQPA
jgi:fatty-acyl-CoA synthase